MVIDNINRTFCFSFCNDFQSGLVREIGVMAYACLSCLRHHANFNNGHANPSIRTIAKECGISKTTAEKYLSWLTDRGLAREISAGGSHRSKTYIVRERIEIKSNNITIAWMFTDYVPTGMREHVEKISQLLRSGNKSLLEYCDIKSAPGYRFDSFDMIFTEEPNAIIPKAEEKIPQTRPTRSTGSKRIFELVQKLGNSR